MTFKEDDLLFTDEQRHILESLHLKVMPFIMRRLKSEVLKELPQKIIQDYYCQMTEEQ
jgi:TATA-binding protein-associated factor